MSDWSTFVSQVKALPIVKQRAVSAIVGAVVADAAGNISHTIFNLTVLKLTFLTPRINVFAMQYKCYNVLLAQPLFWVYDQDKILTCLEGGKNPEFYEPTQNPFFILPNGSSTMCGDCTMAGIRGLLQGKGSLTICTLVTCL